MPKEIADQIIDRITAFRHSEIMISQRPAEVADVQCRGIGEGDLILGVCTENQILQ